MTPALPLALVILGQALSPPRVAVIIEANGAASGRSRAAFETLLGERVASGLGAIVVEEEHLAALRAAAERGDLTEGKMGGALTTQDADLIVAGRLEVTPKSSPLLPSLHAFSAAADLRVFSADGGARVASAQTVASAPAQLDPLTAERATLERLADALFRELEPALRASSSAKRIEVAIRAPQGLSTPDVERAVAAIRALPGVAGARIVRREPTRMQVDVEGPRLDAEQLANALEEDASAALVVDGFSARSVLLRFVPAKSGRLLLRLLALERSRATLEESRLAEALIAGALRDLDFVDLTEREPASFEVRGRIEGSRNALHVNISLRAVGGAYALAHASSRCKTVRRSTRARSTYGEVDAPVAVCLEAVARELADRMATLRADGRLGLASTAELEAGALEGPGLFPALAGHYIEHPVAFLKVSSSAKRAIELRVEAELDDLSANPRLSPPVRLPPSGSARVPLLLELDPGALDRVDATRQGRLRLTLVETAPERGGVTRRRIERALLIFDKNALEWRQDEGAALAGFINGRDPAVLGLARAAVEAIPSGVAESPFALPAALVEALRQVRYREDPRHPFRPEALDYVQFPGETLASGSGDCDDLTVLFASLTEAAGRDALVVTTPGHVLAAIDLRVSPGRRGSVALHPSALLEHEGALYLPIEVTQMSGGFRKAWSEARAELARASGAGAAPRVFRVSEVRTRYPAAGLALGPKGSYRVRAEGIADEVTAAETTRTAALEAEVERLRRLEQPDALNALGVLLAQDGRLEDAAAVFRELLPAMKSVAPRNNLGAVALVQEEPRRAFTLLHEAAEAEPSNIRVQLNAILAALAAGEDEALDDLLLRLEPDVLRPFWARVRAFRSLRGAPGAASGLAARLLVRLEALGLEVKTPALRAGNPSPEVGWADLVYWIR